MLGTHRVRSWRCRNHRLLLRQGCHRYFASSDAPTKKGFPLPQYTATPGTLGLLCHQLGESSGTRVENPKNEKRRCGHEDSELPTRTPGKPPVALSGRPAKSWEVTARPTKEQPSFITSFIHLRRGTVHEAILKFPVNKPAKKMSINSRNKSPIYIPNWMFPKGQPRFPLPE